MSNAGAQGVSIRLAERDDCLRVWEWRNEQATREASFDTRNILYQQHESWFSRKLVDPQTLFFIVLNDDKRAVGYVRFELAGQKAEISISIDRQERGKSYGTKAIAIASDHLFATTPVRRIFACVKTDNSASRAAFERAGFTLEGVRRISGVEAWELIYKRK